MQAFLRLFYEILLGSEQLHIGDKSPNYVIYGNDALLIHACEPQQQFNGGYYLCGQEKSSRKRRVF